MNDRVLSLEATKEFLKKYDCDKNSVSIFGPTGPSDSYPVSGLTCGPE